MENSTMPEEKKVLSFGEKRIRTEFNPSNDSVVQHIKERAAELLNYINDSVVNCSVDQAELGRLKALAFTHLETAAMFAVKAATI